MQLLVELIKSVESLPDGLYDSMHSALINSANDKDAAVRVQVVIVLGKLARGEDIVETEEGVQSLTDILQNLMRYDPSPEVRRAALPGVHTQINKHTLPVLLSRAKDPDANVRRTVFRILKTTPVPVRSLSLEQRTLIVRYGLEDRAPVVKAEASKLLASWVDGMKDLEEFVSLFDLSSDKIAEDALGAVLVERPELLNEADLSAGENRSGSHRLQTL
jgi:condensin complex subunit 3